MAWTTPRTWTTGELVTAAHMNTDIRDNTNFLASWETTVQTQDVSGFTNVAFADLDALTTAAFSNPVIVTLTTGTTVLVIISANAFRNNTAASGAFMSWRVSGATTIAASDTLALRNNGLAADGSNTFAWLQTLTAGTNTFELQARVNANAGRIINPSLTVIPQA